MKKFSISLLCCLLFCFGMFTFAGCDNLPTVQNISIATTPTKTSYLIGEQLDLSGGILNVTYTDGSTSQLPLSVATPSEYTFSTAGDKIVTLSFQQKVTTFGVSIAKRDIQLSPTFEDNLPSPCYTGEPLPLELRNLNTITLGEDSTYTVEYKQSNQPDSAYTTTAPTIANTYTVRIQIQGGTTFNDMTIDNGKAIVANYIIQPTTLAQLSTLPITSGYTLEYNFSQYTNFTYGDIIDFSKCWVIGQNGTTTQYGPAPLPEQFRNQLKYSYREKDSSTWTEIPSFQGTNIIGLDAGEYEIMVSLNTTNVQDYSLKLPFVVNQKQLVIGTDYHIQAFNNGAGYPLTPGSNNSIPYNGKAYEILPYTEKQDIAITLKSVKYIDKDNNINSLPPVNAGTYTATYTLSAGGNYQPITASIEFEIYKLTIDLPTINDLTVQYDGNSKKFYIDGLDTKLTYTIQYSVAGKDNYTDIPPTDKGTYNVMIKFAFVDNLDAINYTLPTEIANNDNTISKKLIIE